MPKAGKYFRIPAPTLEQFDQWCAARRWINQGALVDSLLQWVMKADGEALMKLLDSPPTEDTEKGEAS